VLAKKNKSKTKIEIEVCLWCS